MTRMTVMTRNDKGLLGLPGMTRDDYGWLGLLAMTRDDWYY